MDQTPGVRWPVNGLLEFLILLLAVMATVALLWMQGTSGKRGDDLSLQTAALRDHWAVLVETPGIDPLARKAWQLDKTAMLEELKPVLPLEPTLVPLLEKLKSLPPEAATMADYGKARSVFDRILQALEEIRHRQTTAFQNILFFTLALGGLAIGFLIWRIQRLRWSASIDSLLTARAVQRGKIQEHERWRIARELHDGVAQELARAKLCFEQLECASCPQTTNKSVRDDLSGALSFSIKEIRWICGGLRRAGPSEATLELILEQSAAEFRARYGLPTAVQRINELSKNWDEAALHEIARIVQEGFTNVGRHSGASQVLLRSLTVGSSLKIQVEDDGSGIRGEEGFGMQGMRERAVLLGGTVHWDQLEPGGTRMTLTIPIPEALT